MRKIKNIFFIVKIYYLLFLNRLEIARHLCLKQIEFSKQSTRLYHALLGDILKRQGQNELAITEYKFALKESKSQFFTDYYNLISLYFKIGKFEEVIDLANKCFQQKFTFVQNKLKCLYSADIYWYLGQVAARTQRYEVSIENFKKYLLLTKRDAKEIYESLGYCYEQLGKYDEAIRNYEKALSIDPTLIVSRHNLNQIREKQQQKM